MKKETAFVMYCVQTISDGEWKKLISAFYPGEDERLVVLTDKNWEKRELKDDCEAILIVPMD